MSGLFTRRKSPLTSNPPSPKKYQQKFWKTGKQLEKGRSYSMVSSRTGFLSQKNKYSLTPLGKFKGVNTKDAKPGTVSYDFERKNVPVPLDEALNPKRKKFILNCEIKKNGGTRRAASQVRRHTRRRVPQ